jgi:hypothetical protein
VSADADLWQRDTIEALTAALEADDVVKALVLIGSCAYPDAELDEWSDVDAVVVVEDGALPRFHPAADWLDEFGQVYACDVHADGPLRVIRTYFTDGRRLDVIVVPESALEGVEDWEFNPFHYGVRCVFSRSPRLDRALEVSAAAEPAPARTPDSLDRLTSDFWFKGMLAVSKVARGDLLVALHLSLDLIRDCCALAMMLRDRETGTNHHRDGSGGRHSVGDLAAAHRTFTPHGILSSIEQSSIVFDRLAAEWDAGYQERRDPLVRWVQRVRHTLPEERQNGREDQR